MQRISFYLTIAQLAALRKLAEDGPSVAGHIRQAIDQYLERIESEKAKSASISPSAKIGPSAKPRPIRDR